MKVERWISLLIIVIYHLTKSVSSIDLKSAFMGTDKTRNLSLLLSSNGGSSLKGCSITIKGRYDETSQGKRMPLTLHFYRPIRWHNTGIRSHTVKFRSRGLHFKGHFFIRWITQLEYFLGCTSKWSFGGVKQQPWFQNSLCLTHNHPSLWHLRLKVNVSGGSNCKDMFDSGKG